MLKFAVAFAVATGLAVPAALAEAPTLRSSEDTRLSTIFAPEAPVRVVARKRARGTTYSYLPAHPSQLAPGSGPPARAMIRRETRYFYQPPLAAEFDGAPCPTRSRDSLGELFACTLR